MNPIPNKYKHEFIGYVTAYDDSSLPDGAWFQIIEDQCSELMFIHKIKGNTNSAAHQLIRWREE